MDTITPNQLTDGRDQLLAAGSKISYRDLYDLQIKIPLHKRNFYKADDVDSVFVTINGVLMDVSAQAHRDQKALSEARLNLAEKDKELQSKSKLVENLSQQNEKLEIHLGNLVSKMAAQDAELESEEINERDKKIMKLESRNRYLTAEHRKALAESESLSERLQAKTDDYTRLLESSAEKFQKYEEQLSQAPVIDPNLVESLNYQKALVGNLENERDTLREHIKEQDAELKAQLEKYELLEYKFNQLRQLSERRIAELLKNDS